MFDNYTNFGWSFGGDAVATDFSAGPVGFDNDMLAGDSNTLPLMSDTSYGYGSGVYNYSDNTLPVSEPQFSPWTNNFGSVKSGINDFRQVVGSVSGIARDIGTAVGEIRRAVTDTPKEYTRAVKNAERGNSLGQFWQYATPTDKMMISLAGLAVVVVLVK